MNGKGSSKPLSDTERRTVLFEWNDTAAPYPRVPVHRRIEAVARSTPEAIAVESESERLSYGDLDRLSNRLAHRLRARGVGPEVMVAVCCDRSIAMVVGFLGALKAGGAFVPIDPTYPEARIRLILEEAKPPVLVTRPHLADRLSGWGDVVELDDSMEVLSGAPETPPEVADAPDRIAYVIFTSGSTGRPKGILLEHGGLSNVVDHSNRLFEIGPSSRVLQFAAIGFDVCVWEVFMALTAGATLTLSTQRSLFALMRLPEMLRDRRITVALLPPSLLAVIPAKDLPHLRTVVAVGERCTHENVARWSPGRSFFNGYGPAEGTITVSVYRADAADTGEKARPLGPPIGRPLPNVRLYVLDERLEPVPVGETGELCVGGVAVARGYLDRPELTAERFVADPFSPVKGGRLYRTGDMARFLPDGNLEFVGRMDDQIKIRGFRVELGEIEAVLRTLDEVVSAAVVAAGEEARKRLVAFFQTDPDVGEGDLSESLRRELEGLLPDYMVPSTLCRLETLPRSPNGKIDRKALVRCAESTGPGEGGLPPEWIGRFLTSGGDPS